MFRDATRAVKLVAAAMATAEFDAARLEARAGDGWTTLTELADTLVREHGLPFQTAHAIAARLDRRRGSATRSGRCRVCSPTASTELLGAPLTYSEAAARADPQPAAFRRRAARRSAVRRRRRPRARPARRARSSTPIERGGRRRPTRSPTAERALAERSAAL